MQTAGDLAADRPFYRRFLPAFLFDADQPWPLYVAKGWLLTLLPSLALGLLVSMVVQPGPGGLPSFELPEWILFIGLVLFAPSVETLLMLGPLLLLRRLFGAGPAVVGSSALWGGLHSLSAPAWGLVAWWPFFIFSAVLLFWRSHGRLWRGVGLVILIHALQNFVPFSLIALG